LFRPSAFLPPVDENVFLFVVQSAGRRQLVHREPDAPTILPTAHPPSRCSHHIHGVHALPSCLPSGRGAPSLARLVLARLFPLHGRYDGARANGAQVRSLLVRTRCTRHAGQHHCASHHLVGSHLRHPPCASLPSGSAPWSASSLSPLPTPRFCSAPPQREPGSVWR